MLHWKEMKVRDCDKRLSLHKNSNNSCDNCDHMKMGEPVPSHLNRNRVKVDRYIDYMSKFYLIMSRTQTKVSRQKKAEKSPQHHSAMCIILLANH